MGLACMQRQEMAAVKAERARLLEQLTLVKTDPGKAGGELQQADIGNLRREVEAKKAKLNEIHEVSKPLAGTALNAALALCSWASRIGLSSSHCFCRHQLEFRG